MEKGVTDAKAAPRVGLALISLLTNLVWFTGCQTEEKSPVPLPSPPPAMGHRLEVPARPIPARAWKDEIDQWRGTPFQFGGLTRGGVDCSGLVFQVYRSVAGVTLPRTSQRQYRRGLPVTLNELKPGDLVFFALAGADLDHVGISLGDDKFAHATTTKGVVISSLQNRAYAEHFYGAKRILQSN